MLQLDTGLGTHFTGLGDVPHTAREAEEHGFGALWIPETKHDPFLPVVLAAEHTQRIRLGTAVAIAFPRSPMVRRFLNLTYEPAAKKIDWPRLIQALAA
jgi:alkanesulfonate monooxygenase SsuD/methylene tetrahydromethanopterin reductase-like flavin-dependent oxidoreductase (luciferase family)